MNKNRLQNQNNQTLQVTLNSTVSTDLSASFNFLCVCVCYYCMCVLHVRKSDADACILQTPRWSWKLTELTSWTVTRKMYKRVKGRNFQAYRRRRGWTTVVRMMMMDLNWLNPSHFHFETFAGSSLLKITLLMEWSKRALVMKVTQKKSHMGSFIQEMDWHGVHYFLLGLGVAWRQTLCTKSLPHKSPTLHLCLIQLTVSNLFFLMTSLMSLWRIWILKEKEWSRTGKRQTLWKYKHWSAASS